MLPQFRAGKKYCFVEEVEEIKKIKVINLVINKM